MPSGLLPTSPIACAKKKRTSRRKGSYEQNSRSPEEGRTGKGGLAGRSSSTQLRGTGSGGADRDADAGGAALRGGDRLSFKRREAANLGHALLRRNLQP